MKIPHLIRILLPISLLLSFSGGSNASALQGQAVEVIDGGTVTIISFKKPVKVRLIGLAAPQKGQAYSDVAQQHLSDLILNKYVVVRYSTLGQDGYLSGKILLNDSDIGQQMI